MDDPDGPILGQRLRVARAYAGLQQKPMSALLGMSVSTYARRERGDWPQGEALKVMPLVVEHTGVPAWFVEHGWRPPEPQAGTRDPRTRAELDALRKEVTGLRAALVSLASGNLRRTQELLARLERDRPDPHEGEAQ